MNLHFLKLRAWLLLLGATLPIASSVRVGALPTNEDLAGHQKRARQAEARQDFVTAIAEYKILVGAVPNSAELRSNLGVALYFHHDLNAASEVLRQAIAINKNLYPPHLFLGMAMAHLSRPGAAIVELQRATVLNPSDPVAHKWLGYEYTAESHFAEASRQLEIAARQNGADQDVWYALGRCYLALGKRATSQLLQEAPDSGRAWQLAAEQYEAQGNKAKALQFYRGALARRPDLEAMQEKVRALGGTIPQHTAPSSHANTQEDALYEQVETFEQKARAAFEKISQIDPASYRAHQMLGDSAAAADHLDVAIREYRAAIEEEPDLPGLHGDLCNALSRTAQIDAAIKECDEELTLSPYSSAAYVDAARVHLLAHEDEGKAAAYLKRALELGRPPIAAYKLLAKIDLDRNDYQAAIADLDRYTQVEKKDASAYFLLARAYKAVGNRAKMNQSIREYKLDTQFGAAQRTLDRHNDEYTRPHEGMSGNSSSQ